MIAASDCDGTIIRGDATRRFLLLLRGPIGLAFDLFILAQQLLAWRLGRCSTAKLKEAVLNRAQHGLAGFLGLVPGLCPHRHARQAGGTEPDAATIHDQLGYPRLPLVHVFVAERCADAAAVSLLLLDAHPNPGARPAAGSWLGGAASASTWWPATGKRTSSWPLSWSSALGRR